MASREKLLKSQSAEGQKEILKLTSDARKAVELQVIDAVNKGNFAQAATVRDGLYKGIAEEYVRLNRGVDDWTVKRSGTVSKAWHTLAIDDLPTAKAGSTFGQFSKKYLDDIIGKINPSTIGEKVGVGLNPQIGGMLNEDIRAIRTAVSNTIRTGALTGMTNPQLSAEMRRATQAIKPGALFIDKAGRKWNSDSYFSMLNRTLHANVARETYNSTVVDAGFDLVRVDGSSSDPDSPCLPWEGKILSVSGTSKKYPSLAEAEATGLHHPNCIHTESVYIP